ncbi:hypothetical protein B7R22_09840 [Subtercola boreus]|uniref:Uncharacterized protein n=2 Tax=Subtercola boreus TaxID=120213 RepID=A0A3E0VWS6_9MICO|nr:hypothetical protein B7R22_09840 [Subtercola boreus]
MTETLQHGTIVWEAPDEFGCVFATPVEVTQDGGEYRNVWGIRAEVWFDKGAYTPKVFVEDRNSGFDMTPATALAVAALIQEAAFAAEIKASEMRSAADRAKALATKKAWQDYSAFSVTQVAAAMRAASRSPHWVAQRAEISPRIFERKMRGRADFTVGEIASIARALGISPALLIGQAL